jgi:hypothetical protein
MNKTLPHPSLARARDLGLEVITRSFFGGESNLLTREPDEESMQVAIVMRALVQRRAVQDARVWMSGPAVKRLRDEGLQPVPPRARFDRYVQRALAEIHDRKSHACTHCSFTPGRAMCPICVGQGTVQEDEDSLFRRREGPVRCSACAGSGGTRCGPCDGEGQVFPVTVRTLSVGVGELEYVFVPAMAPSLHAALSQCLLGADALPAAFSFDVERPIVNESMSYRSHVPIGPERIYGIEAGQPLTEARVGLQRLSAGGEVIDRAVECFAVPFCLLRFGETRLALVSLEPTSIVVLQGVEET